MNAINRRAFLTTSTVAGLVPLAAATANAAESSRPRRDYYELRQYLFDTADQRKGFDAFMRDAAIPALNRVKVQPVGVFFPQKDLSPAYVLLRHSSPQSVATVTQRLLADAEYLEKGAAFLDAPAEKPAFKRVETALLLAFKGMPQLETPVKAPGRIVQLRIYESPSVKTGQKKIEMFNDAGEIAIFREVGLHPVFFGEALAGTKMPNLTYMLAFESEDEMKANWKKFGSSPGWQKLRAMPEYADKRILCGITNLVLKPADYSQI